MQIIDVTLRDGGHVREFNWPFKFAREHYDSLCKIPEIKFIELGYWKQTSKSKNPLRHGEDQPIFSFISPVVQRFERDSALQLVEARGGWGALKVCREQIGLSAGERPRNRCDSSCQATTDC